MTPFEDLVDKLDTLVLRRMTACSLGAMPILAADAEERVVEAKKSLVAAIEAIHGPIDIKAVFTPALSYAGPALPVPTDPDRWAKAALKASADDTHFVGINWDNIDVEAQDHWRLVADAVRNVKP